MKKENEFIISSEELRENQKRVLEAEKAVIKLEKEVAKENQIMIITICAILIIFMILIAFIFNSGTKGVEACVKAGNTVQYCEAELLR